MFSIRVLIVLICICKLQTAFAQSQNNALRLDGIDDYVNLNSLIAPLSGTTDFTIEFWVKNDFTKNTVQPRVNFIAINPAAPAENKFAIIMGEPGTAQSGRLSIYEAFGSTKYLTSPGLVGDQQCHHVAYVRRGLVGEGFLDGVSFGTIPVGAVLASDDRVSIGQDWDNLLPSDFYNGDFDDLRIWNVARTAAEINANMNAKFTGTEPGLLAFYPFNQGTGDGDNTGLVSLRDQSPNHFDGVLTNFSLTGSASNWVRANFAPEITLAPDSILCPGASITLNGPAALAYKWSDGSSAQNTSIDLPGTYWLEANNGVCVSSDTIQITTLSPPAAGNRVDTLCSGTSLTLVANDPVAASYVWNTDSGASSITVEQAGLYTVEKTNVCGTTQMSFTIAEKKCDCFTYVPNSFTPNNDKLNPEFKMVYDCPIASYNIKIYDRWGELVYESQDPEAGWDGSYGKKAVQMGVYTYKIKFVSELSDEERELKGHIELTR